MISYICMNIYPKKAIKHTQSNLIKLIVICLNLNEICCLGVRPYKCNLCEKSFTQRCSLESHCLKVHGAAHQYDYKQRRSKVILVINFSARCPHIILLLLLIWQIIYPTYQFCDKKENNLNLYCTFKIDILCKYIMIGLVLYLILNISRCMFVKTADAQLQNLRFIIYI